MSAAERADNDLTVAAQGIPWHPGDHVVFLCGKLPGMSAIVLTARDRETGTHAVRHRYGEGYAGHGDAVIDLSHPGTRSAYDHRLALAFGAPEAAANDGVIVFYLDGIGDWFVGAGWNGSRNDFAWCRRFQEIDADDPIMFRALAWPADKRVRE